MADDKLIPPYVSWGIFYGTLTTLAETTVPTAPLDRRVLHTLSGADHGALMSALRYLHLVDGERKATADYRAVIEAVASKNTEKTKELMLRILDTAYSSVLNKVDLESGTITQLERAFRDEEVSQGQMLTKTVRFFIKAYAAYGVPLSPHITKSNPKPRSTAKANGADKPRSRTQKTPRRKEPSETSPEVVPPDFSRLPIPGIADAFIQYPNDLTEPQCALLDAAIALLRAYVKSQKGGGKREG